MRGGYALPALLWPALLATACAATHSAIGPQGLQPQLAAEELLSVALTPDNAVIADDDADSVVMIELAASPRPAGPRPAVAMAIVLDSSGSMEGPNWDHAERAAHALIDELSSGDGVVVVSYADSATVHFQSFSLDDEGRAQAHQAIDGMEPLGNTCISCGLEWGYSVLASAPAGQLRRLVLMSDGLANRGTTDSATLLSMAAAAHTNWQTDTSTIGLGRLHDTMLMAALAESGSASYYYLSDAAQLAEVLDRELSYLQTTVLTNLRLYVTPGDGVTIAGTPNSGAYMSGSDLIFDLGQLALGEQRQLLVQLALPPGDMGRILTATASFVDPTGFSYSLEAAARVVRSNDAAEIERSLEPRVLEQLSLMQSMSSARDAIQALQTDGTQAGLPLLREAAERLRSNALQYQSSMLDLEAERVEELADELQEEESTEDEREPERPSEVTSQDWARSNEILRGVPPTEAYHQ